MRRFEVERVVGRHYGHSSSDRRGNRHSNSFGGNGRIRLTITYSSRNSSRSSTREDTRIERA